MSYEDFVKEYQSILLGFSRRFAGNREDAQDLYQETTIKLYKHFDSWDQSRDATNWIIQIMKRTWQDQCRARRRRVDTISFDFYAVNPVIQFRDNHQLQDELVADRSELAESIEVLTEKRQTIVNGMLVGKDIQCLAQEMDVSNQIGRAHV